MKHAELDGRCISISINDMETVFRHVFRLAMVKLDKRHVTYVNPLGAWGQICLTGYYILRIIFCSSVDTIFKPRVRVPQHY